MLAVKPRSSARALAALGGRSPDLARPLWVSIAAGVPLARARGALLGAARASCARCPTRPALVRAGATAICGNDGRERRATSRSRARCSRASALAGRRPREALLDAVTGLSGSGPAYVFVFLEALGDAGVRDGPAARRRLSSSRFQTVLGAAQARASKTGRHPAALKDQVTSPGGTTIAGLERLEAGGLRAAVYDAVAAATRRSEELARGELSRERSGLADDPSSCVKLSADHLPQGETAVRLTPLDIRTTASRAAGAGYDPSEVETFLRMVVRRTTRRRCASATSSREKMRALEQRVEELSANETLLQETLITAQHL